VTRRGWSLFAAMCLIWGIPYLLIRVAVEHVSPGTLVLVRTGLAALVLLPIVVHRRQVGPVLARWRPMVLFTVVEVMIPWLLIAHAETEISSSLAGLLIATVPLVGALAFLLTTHAERFSRVQWGGLLLGFAGVASLVGLDLGELHLVSVAEMLGVAICYAAGPLIMARFLSDLPVLGVMTGALTICALAYLPYGLLHPPTGLPADAVASLVVLALLCTALGFVLFGALISEAGPTRATLFTYVNPAVAIALGALLLGERITVGMLVGFPLILVGSVVAAGGARATVAEAELEPAA
jgi:drug/metabolite transporter (DMT)-like permease